MVGLDTIVWFVFGAIVAIIVLAILWWVIGYAEKKFPLPMVWNGVRVAFVLLVAFFMISVLLGLLGHPIIRW